MTKLSDAEIQACLSQLPDWSELNGSIQRTFQFPDFVTAMQFVHRIAQCAEERQHHPDILIRYNKVTMTLSTHDSGGITAKDFDLAREIDSAAAALGVAPAAQA